MIGSDNKTYHLERRRRRGQGMKTTLVLNAHGACPFYPIPQAKQLAMVMLPYSDMQNNELL